MKFDDHEVVIDKATKFGNFLFIGGWVNPAVSKIKGITLLSKELVVAEKVLIGLDHGGVLATLGRGRGFELQLFLKDPFNFEDEIIILFELADGNTFQSDLNALIGDRLARYPSYEMGNKFNETLRQDAGARVLDIGGRSRSKLDRSKFFPNTDYTVLDIIPGENVDVLGDAHNLSMYFEADSFDYIVSTSVFEHLSMPWKVALEMNRVLKIGGKAMIQTHQSIGMHDVPWDFFRFSDSAWDGIFNIKTGFKITDRVLDHENFVLPFVIRPGQLDAEKSAGFEVSLVIVEKISDSILQWNVNQEDILGTTYPTHEEGSNPKFRALLARGIVKIGQFFNH